MLDEIIDGMDLSKLFHTYSHIGRPFALNNPVRVVPVSGIHGNLPNKHSMITCNQENIVIETIKKAEDLDDVVIRLYDAYNLTTQVEIGFGFDVQSIYL